MLKLIERNTPKIKDNFIIKTIPNDNGCDCYEVYTEGEKVLLAGNNTISLAMAYYRYLNEYCNVVLTSGDYDISYISRTPLPEEKIKYTVKQKIRARMSYEMFSLEGNFWGFDRWEKEIDFMAMNGINTALQAVGFDGVLYHTLVSLGMPENFCLEFSSGPAFLSRQITGNIAGTNSVNSLQYLERKIAIGKMITERENELGISPVFPAAMPSVPFSLRKKYIKMDIFKAPLWYNFPPIFYIKPENSFFSVMNKKFLEMQKKLLGEAHSYAFEPLYDVDQKGFTSHLSGMGKALANLLAEFDDESVCYIHIGSIAPEFFKDISARRYIIIDDKDEHNKSSFLNDKNFIVGINGNRYGRTGLYGDIDKISKCPYKEASKLSTALGTAICLDTFDVNPLFCSCVLKAAVANDGFDSTEFIKDYSLKRYATDAYTDELIKLKELCYNTNDCAGSIVCARPSTMLKHTAPYDTIERKFDFHALYDIASRMLASDARKNDNMRADIQSIVKQILVELAYPVYMKSTASFKEKNVADYETASNLFLEICKDIDRILKTRIETNLYTKIDEARQLGDSKDEKQSLEINFLMLHTIWSPLDHSILYDTVWSEWGGLVDGFYLQRWYMYYRSLAAYFNKPSKLKDYSKKQPLDRNEYQGSYQAKRLTLFENNFLENFIPRKDGICEEDTVEVAKELLEKYSEVIKAF